MKNFDALKKVGPETGMVSKSARQLKKILFLAGLSGILLSFNSCMTGGYVTSEPMYVEHSRPPQPSSLHVWINDGWGWNRSNHAYVQTSGYWQKPVQNRTYKSGYWQTTPKGKSWAPGRWEKKNR